jgi:hypothetical protein
MKDLLVAIVLITLYGLGSLGSLLARFWWLVLLIVIPLFGFGLIPSPSFGAISMDWLLAPFAFFAAGFGFWLLWAAIVCGLVWFAEEEWGVWTTGLAIGAAAIAVFGFGMNPLQWIGANPWYYTPGVIAAYLLGGVVWLAIRWAFLVQGVMDKKADQIAEYKASNPEWKQDDLIGYLKTRDYSFPPRHRDHVSSIIFWVGYWPFSAVGTLARKPLYYISRFIYNRMSGFLNNVTGWIVKANLR